VGEAESFLPVLSGRRSLSFRLSSRFSSHWIYARESSRSHSALKTLYGLNWQVGGLKSLLLKYYPLKIDSRQKFAKRILAFSFLKALQA
jgi:hypothetical protein